jgi:uncharacterized membrane protein
MLKLIGIITAIVGISHFFAPDVYKPITAPAFPDNTDQAIQVNGACETAIGLAIASQRTRKLGLLGAGVYAGWLGFNAQKQLS